MIRAYLAKPGWMEIEMQLGLSSVKVLVTLNEAAALAEQIELALPPIDPDRGEPVMDA